MKVNLQCCKGTAKDLLSHRDKMERLISLADKRRKAEQENKLREELNQEQLAQDQINSGSRENSLFLILIDVFERII